MVLNKKNFLISVYFCVFFSGFTVVNAQSYLVQFRDKRGSGFSTGNPEAFLTERAIWRRAMYNIRLDESDLPVPASYINQVASVPNVKIKFPLKWLNGVVVTFTDESLAKETITKLDALEKVKLVTKSRKLKLDKLPEPEIPDYETPALRTAGTHMSGYLYGGSNGQIKQLRLECLHELGYRGQGMVIALCDAGYTNTDSSPVFDSVRANGGILGTMDFVSGGTDVYHGSTHGTMVFSCIAGNIPGLVSGTAPMAKYWLIRTEEGATETIKEEYNWVRAAEFLDSVGVDMINTSLGYTEFDNPAENHTYSTLNGRTAPMSIAATMAARKGILVFNSAGNQGGSPWRYISVPADADSICAVGAVDTTGKLGEFSSRGPTADGRIKPDLVATGSSAWVCNSGTVCFPAGGTSFSSPILTGAAACFWQAHRQMNNIEVLNTLKAGASRSRNPDNNYGWGIPTMCDKGFDFKVYSNPFTSTLLVHFSFLEYERISLEIFDLTGKILFSQNLGKENRAIKLDTINMTEGIYCARLITSEGSKTIKFLKLNGL